MKRGHLRFALVIAALAMIGAAILASDLFRPLGETRQFHVPDRAEAADARSLFEAALGGEFSAAVGARAAALGLELRPIADAAGQFAIREAGHACRGNGLYRLREAPALPLALMAPHRGSDRRTGTLVALLFDELPVAAAAWNSAPRRPTDACRGGGDPTRVETHFLTAFSLAFAKAHPRGRMVQLHGFEPRLRQSRAAQLADIIASDGTNHPGARLLDLADCLSARLHPRRVLVFPGDTRELGATQNRQGRALRAEGFNGFVHLELSAALRRSLVEDRALRARFAACLDQGLA